MGICLHAIVEFQVVRKALDGERSDDNGERIYWEDVAEVQFNKHRFRYALGDDPRIREGWPEDVSIEEWERDERCIDQGLRWCDLATLADMVERGPRRYDEQDPDEGPYRGQPAALAAFMRSFENEGIRTRVLFYES